MPAVRRHIGKDIQANGEFEITRIEIYQVIRPSRRNVVQQFLSQVAVRVNHPDAMSKSDMLDDHIPQQCGLAGASFADDVDVLPLVGDQYAKRLGITPAFAFPDGDEWLVVHGSKTSRHSFPQKVSMSSDFRLQESTFAAGKVLGGTPAR
jgi:hypothetical protein